MKRDEDDGDGLQSLKPLRAVAGGGDLAPLGAVAGGGDLDALGGGGDLGELNLKPKRDTAFGEKLKNFEKQA